MKWFLGTRLLLFFYTKEPNSDVKIEFDSMEIRKILQFVCSLHWLECGLKLRLWNVKIFFRTGNWHAHPNFTTVHVDSIWTHFICAVVWAVSWFTFFFNHRNQYLHLMEDGTPELPPLTCIGRLWNIVRNLSSNWGYRGDGKCCFIHKYANRVAAQSIRNEIENKMISNKIKPFNDAQNYMYAYERK